MQTLSYAQNLEDVLLNRVFADRPSGFYIDVGAYHPIDDSVTKLFYERGWHGINIEPLPPIFEVLAADRPRDINLPVGLSNCEGTLAFYEVPSGRPLSTFSREQAEDHRRAGFEIVEHRIPVTTLARVCEQYHVPTIDFLKIDVESFEREVLEGGDWKRYRPRIVLLEATKPFTTIPTHDHWESVLLSADYLFAFFDGLNRYYVRAEDRELIPLLSVPANVFDEYDRYSHRRRVQELERQIQHLRHSNEEMTGSRDSLRDTLEHTRTVLAGTQEELAATRQELAATRQELDATRAALDEVRGRLRSTESELVTARARLELFEGWGPMTVGVVRRLRRISVRIPLARSLLRRAILIRRAILAHAASSPIPH